MGHSSNHSQFSYWVFRIPGDSGDGNIGDVAKCFPHNGQHCISYSFEAKGDESNKLQLKQVDISTLNEFSYFIFPYEVTDYTSVETAGALSFPVNIEKHKLYTILMGPVPENALHAETEISLDFNDFQHHFGWEALPLD